VYTFSYVPSLYSSLSWLLRLCIIVHHNFILFFCSNLQCWLQPLFIRFYNTTPIWTMRWSWSLDAWRILINPIRSWFSWSRRILNPLIFRNKSSLSRNWILFILLLKRKLAIVRKGNYFTLICFFCFKPSSSPTQLDFLGLSFPLKK